MKLNKRVIAGATVTGLMVVGLTACSGDSSKTKAQNTEQQQASNGLNSLLRDQPVHSYQYSQVRQNLQELEDAQANGTVTTSFFMHMGLADPVFSCPSIGAPIASTTELTNPQQIVNGNSDHGTATINQADPTGVYTGQSTGTYILCVGANGAVNPVYWEGNVMTAFGPAVWNKTTHMMEITGPSGSKFSNIKK